MAEPQQNSDDIVKPPPPNPPIIMKIEAPVEDTNKQDDEDNENTVFPPKGETASSFCAPNFIRKSTIASSNPFASSQNNLSRGILKPPQLSLNNTSSPGLVSSRTSFTLNPSRLNTFASKSSSSSSYDSGKSDHNSDKKCGSGQASNGEMPKFVPLLQSEKDITAAPTTTTTPTINSSSTSTTETSTANTIASAAPTSKNSFVFGQNLQERAIAGESSEDPKPSTSVVNSSNGTAEMLFSNVMKSEAKAENNTTKDSTTKSLSESAREYEELRANKRKYEEVEVKTGEEEETNILSISCKLYAYETISGSWQERGRGTLRLNDLAMEENHSQSRLVFRTSGSLRVILNTKIWAEMTVEQASEKSIRLTALDAKGEIKVFLIMANIEDSKHLYQQLQSRLQKEVTAQKRKKVDSDMNAADSEGGH